MFAYIAIIAATGIASSIATYHIWKKESFQNYDKYDAYISELIQENKTLNKNIQRLIKQNSQLQAKLADQNTRFNPAQVEFFDMPSKKALSKKGDLFGEW